MTERQAQIDNDLVMRVFNKMHEYWPVMEVNDPVFVWDCARDVVELVQAAAAAVGRGRVTFTPEQADLMKWCVEQGKEVFFYGDGFDDDFLEQLEALEALLTAAPAERGHDETGGVER